MWKIIEIIFQMKFFLFSTIGLFTITNALTCQKGSVPDPRNICIRPKYIQGCFSYATQQTCAQCNFNYKLDANGLCSFNSQSAESCCLQMSGLKCKKCNRGMSLVDGSCVQTQSIGCLEKSATGECTNCASDYVQENGRCLLGIRNCEKYSDSSRKVCESCRPSFSLAANVCLKNKILGCRTQEKEQCVSCFEPFKPTDGHCEIKHCKDYNDFGCESCECGFYITSTMTCNKMEQGCVRYQKGSCTDCIPPFSLQGTVCSIDGCKIAEGSKCTKCSEGYNLQNNLCVLPNCLRGKNGKCEICKQGFNYNNGQCLQSNAKLANF